MQGSRDINPQTTDAYAVSDDDQVWLGLGDMCAIGSTLSDTKSCEWHEPLGLTGSSKLLEDEHFCTTRELHKVMSVIHRSTLEQLADG
jgi:hypothetical protein